MVLGLTQAFSNNGDTLKVKAHQDVVIQTDPSIGVTRYPVWSEFPDASKKYYKVYAYLTFECAPGLKCGEWDYINHIYIGKKGGKSGDSLGWEIGRFITPYGFYWNSSMNWKHGWYYDMTDFAPLLHDSVEIVYEHSGYEAKNDRGWKINLNFFCIEGTPPLEVNKLDTMWTGAFQYGNSANPIENRLAARNVTFDANTKYANLKVIQTGHGMDATDNCAEFCPKVRTVKYDNSTLDQRYIWKMCGFNSLYPQAGTWLYDRTNWCPGDKVQSHDLYIPNPTTGSAHSLDIDMEPYTSGGSFGNWVISSYLVQYKAPTYTTDVELEAIVSPSTEYPNLRMNPICGAPVIVIKNNGKNPLTSLKISYGVSGGTKSVYNWTGNLAFLASDTVTLTSGMDWSRNADIFEVELQQPNGTTDEFAYNNKGTSAFTLPAVLKSNKLIILFQSNSAPTENYYYIKDAVTGNIVHQRNGFSANTTYRDTVELPSGSCFRFEFYDDGPPPANNPLNNDGLSWWANTADGNGSLRLLRSNGQPFMNFNPDFGTKILSEFMVQFPLATKNTVDRVDQAEVYPNPSNGQFTLDYRFAASEGSVEVFTVTGSQVFEQALHTNTGSVNINLSNQAKGIYILKLKTKDGAEAVKRITLQ